MAADSAESTAEQTSQTPVRGFGKVLANEADGHGHRLTLEVPDWPGARPGQFLMIGPGAVASVPRRDPLLPRPMAVYRDLGSDGASALPRIEILYHVVGRGTALLAEAESGDSISVVGPLGQGFAIEAGSHPALLVGGGTGIASLYELAVALAAVGRPVTVLLGARTTPDLIGRSDFEALDVERVYATEDGSLGETGRVTEPLARRLSEAPPNTTVFACGPTPMMKACAELAEAHGVRCFVSLENPMACGFGVCLGCAAPRREGGFSLVCRQGPVFDAREIDWEGLP